MHFVLFRMPLVGGMEINMKQKRQAMILSIIEQYDIETQDELLEKLAEVGFNTTQATIS